MLKLITFILIYVGGIGVGYFMGNGHVLPEALMLIPVFIGAGLLGTL